jgi:glucose/arabinose dehydrogenase
LGLTFHPQFSVNRRFFVDYTRQPDGATVIAEYQASQADPNVADGAETVLLVIQKPFGNHNGGMVEFGPDGFLYIALGDGDDSGSDPGNRAQDITQLLGKILRIDVDHPSGGLPYSSPPDNPFVGDPAGRDEIFAYGLRNPFRFSFDRATGDLYAGDVGQNSVEEIDIITRGGNYGWRIWEGTHCIRRGSSSPSPSTRTPPAAAPSSAATRIAGLRRACRGVATSTATCARGRSSSCRTGWRASPSIPRSASRPSARTRRARSTWWIWTAP